MVRELYTSKSANVVKVVYQSEGSTDRGAHILSDHNDVIKWKHFLRFWPFVRESTGHRWIPLTEASDVERRCFFLTYAWINCWANDRDAGDLRRHRAHYYVTVMRSDYSSVPLTDDLDKWPLGATLFVRAALPYSYVS